MRPSDFRRSDNIEDRRGAVPGGTPVALGGLLVVLLIALLTGTNPLTLLEDVSNGSDSQVAATQSLPSSPAEEKRRDFVAAVLGETEDVWRDVFARQGKTYREPRLVLFNGRVQSECGDAVSASGPFYCPGDQKVYLDMEFFDELSRRLGAPGDFAQAYVIAHEVGHHVQKLLGISDRVDQLRSRMSERESNQLSVRLELQADFLAGVWAHNAERAKNFMESGDLEEALNAASVIGDDRLQKQSQGYVVPDAFTHGTSEQRVRWFKKGYESGDLSQGDTFDANPL